MTDHGSIYGLHTELVPQMPWVAAAQVTCAALTREGCVPIFRAHLPSATHCGPARIACSGAPWPGPLPILVRASSTRRSATRERLFTKTSVIQFPGPSSHVSHPDPTRAAGTPEKTKVRSGLPERWHAQAPWHKDHNDLLREHVVPRVPCIHLLCKLGLLH